MVDGHRSDTHQRGNNRDGKLFGKRGKLLARLCAYNTAAGAYYRLFGFAYCGYCLFYLDGMAFGTGLVPGDIDRLRENRLGFGKLYIYRQVDKHRTGAACLCYMKGFLYDSWKLVYILAKIAVFCKRFARTGDVGLLKCVMAEDIGRNLTGYCDQRNRVHICGGKRSYEICRAGAGGCAAHAGLAGGSGISACGVTGILFVADEYMTDIIAL